MAAAASSYALGLFFILLVSIIWAAASVLVQYLYQEESFDSPFLLTYIGTSLFTIFLPTNWIWKRLCGAGSSRIGGLADDYETVHSVEIEIPVSPSPTTTETMTTSTTTTPRPRIWTEQDHMRAAAKIAPIWFISNWAYNSSLRYTSITSSTVLSSTGSLFTFIFALAFQDESFTLLKFFGVLLGMTGSILTGLHDVQSSLSKQDDNNNNNNLTVCVESCFSNMLLGDALGLVSAVGYGTYAVMVRVLCPRDESLMSMQLFLGYVGLFNAVILSPIAIWQLLGSTEFTLIVFGFVICKGLLDNVLSDYLWARSVVLTSATVATVGLGLTIPMAFASDFVMGRKDVLQPASILGAISVLVGFILVNIGTIGDNTACQEDLDQDDARSGEDFLAEQEGEDEDGEISMVPERIHHRIRGNDMEYSDDTGNRNEII
jgi:solute carrier family 35 protein F5